MTYQWNSAHLGAVFALPAAVADETLRLAGAAQLKALLWFARQGQGDFDPAACAAAIGVPAADCADAMRFWTAVGILREGEADAPGEDTAAVSAAPSVSAPAPTLPALNPAPRPQFPDVVARQKVCPDFDYLLKSAEQRLGRPLTHGEMESFLYIYDTVGLPAEVILMILVNAIQKNRVRAKSGLKTYLVRVAEDWAARGIVTIAAAEQEFCREERREQVRERIQSLFSLGRTPTLLQVETAQKWIDEWGFSDELLLEAFARCREKTGGFQCAYMDRILEGWHADGIATVEAARQASLPRRRSAGKPLPSDDALPVPAADDYEQAAAAYRPVYKKAKPAG